MTENKAVLLVEDDEALGFVTKQALSKRGYEVVNACSLQDARAALSTHTFDIAILDLKLAEDTSLSLIPELRKLNQGMQILMLTAYASIATAVEAVKLGANNYLPKPATVSEILSAINEDEKVDIEQDNMSVMSPKRLEWEHIQRVLLNNDGNISATARELNMHRRTLQRKLQKRPVKD